MILGDPEQAFELPNGFFGLNPNKVYRSGNGRTQPRQSIFVSLLDLRLAAEHLIANQGTNAVEVSTKAAVVLEAIRCGFGLLNQSKKVAVDDLILCASEEEAQPFKTAFAKRMHSKAVDQYVSV